MKQKRGKMCMKQKNMDHWYHCGNYLTCNWSRSFDL